jgi:hypothetical protein
MKRSLSEMPNDAGAAESARLLEALYQLNEVDLTTVRKIGGVSPEIKRQTVPRERLEAIVLPWISSHGGIASQLELEDCLDGESPDFRERLIQIEPDLYCQDQELANSYRQLVTRAVTYFYRPGLFYPLPELVALLGRELAREGLQLPHSFIERCLILAPQFRARKEGSGRVVRRSHLR